MEVWSAMTEESSCITLTTGFLATHVYWRHRCLRRCSPWPCCVPIRVAESTRPHGWESGRNVDDVIVCGVYVIKLDGPPHWKPRGYVRCPE